MKILLVKTSSLGDIIQSFPVLDYLRRRFPYGRLDWVVEQPYAELVRANPHVDRVLTVEKGKIFSSFRRSLNKEAYDLVFDLQGNIKSSSILLQVGAKKKIGFGWTTVPEWPNLLFTSKKVNPPKGRNRREDYLSVVKQFFKDAAPYIFHPIELKLNTLEQQKLSSLFSDAPQPLLVCPSAAWPNKCLSSERLIRALKQLDHSPYWLVWGNKKERESALQISSQFPNSSVLERLTLPLLQHVMARSKLVIAMDSLPLHLCGTTATPSLSFFGPSSAEKYRPLGPQHRAFQGECPYGIRFEKRCPKLRSCETGACLQNEREIDIFLNDLNGFLNL